MPQVTINRQIARLLIAASLLLGSVYPLIEAQLAPLAGVMFKGQCVGLLAIVALLWARSTDGWLLTGVMAASLPIGRFAKHFRSNSQPSYRYSSSSRATNKTILNTCIGISTIINGSSQWSCMNC
jgi:hypothetical protein